MQELLDEDMPDLPEFKAPQEASDISIELQFPSGIADVRPSHFLSIIMLYNYISSVLPSIL